MIHQKISVVLILLFAVGVAIADDIIIEEQGWFIQFIGSETDRKSIAIERLVAPSGEVLVADSLSDGLFQLNVDGDYPTDVTLERLDRGEYLLVASELRDRNGSPAPYILRYYISLKRTRVDFEIEISAQGQVRLDNGLSMFTPMNEQSSISFYNTTADTTSFSWFTEMGDHKRKPFQTSAVLSSPNCNLSIIFPNPLHPVCLLSNDGLNIEILTYAMPNSTVSQGNGQICSVLENGDAISAKWVVMPSATGEDDQTFSSNMVTFSAHPNGAEQSTLLAFDELPSLEPYWAVPTDASNPNTPVTSNLLTLLDRFPKVKFTWLILTDTIQRRGLWVFKDW